MHFIINALLASLANAIVICAGRLVLHQGSNGSTAQARPRCCMFLEKGYVGSEVCNLGQFNVVGI